MIEKLTTYLKFGNRFYGLEHTQLNGEDCYYGICLKKKKKQLDIETSFKAKDLGELKTHIPKGKATALVINTSAVLTKQIKCKAHEPLKLVYMAFPNIKVEDFYYETFSQGEHYFVSICRKTYVDKLLSTYSSKGFTIIDFALGNLASTTLMPFIDFNELKTSCSRITIEEKRITKIIPEETLIESTYNINGLDIKSIMVLSFASALNLVVNNQSIQSSFSDTKKELNTIFNQKQFANQFLKIGFSVLFVILLINFLFFNHYYNEVNTLKETAQVLETSKAKVISLSEKVKKTEKMVADVLKSSSSKSSFYVDDIINHLPEYILLKELNYQPLLKRIKEEKAIENQKHTVLITGQTHNRVLFSQWVSQLEAKPWVDTIKISSFEDTSITSSSFTIKLNMNVTEN